MRRGPSSPTCATCFAASSTSPPGAIVIGLGNPSRDVLDRLFQLSRTVRRPGPRPSTGQAVPRSRLRSKLARRPMC